MSLESATQRLSTALGSLETRLATRIDDMRNELTRLRAENEALQAQAQTLQTSLAQAQAQHATLPPAAVPDDSLRRQNDRMRATLTQTLGDLDSLIARVDSATR